MTQMHQLLFYSHYSKKICMQDTVEFQSALHRISFMPPIRSPDSYGFKRTKPDEQGLPARPAFLLLLVQIRSAICFVPHYLFARIVKQFNNRLNIFLIGNIV